MSKTPSPGYDARVRDSFARQGAMQTMGIEIVEVGPGRLELAMPYNPAYSQQHGFVHAGVITTALDSACGYAAFTLMDERAAVLSVEFKTSLLAPADGERFVFRAEVTKSGRTLSFAEARAYAVKDGREKHIASMSATLMAVMDRAGIEQ